MYDENDQNEELTKIFKLVSLVAFLPRYMECQRGVATRKVSVCLSIRQTRDL